MNIEENERRILRRMKSIFFLHEVKKRKMTQLFGTALSPTLTFILKMQTWLEVRNQLVAAGFPPKKRNGKDLSSATKAKIRQTKEGWGWCNGVD